MLQQYFRDIIVFNTAYTAKNEDVKAIMFAGTLLLKQLHSDSVEKCTLHLLRASFGSKSMKNGRLANLLVAL